MAANQVNRRELICPYCMKSINPAHVLFCTENRNASKDPGYDPQFIELQTRYLSFSPVSKRPDMPGGTVAMEERPMYLYFPWTAEGCPAHLADQFKAPIRMSESPDSLIPAQIEMPIASGYTPKQLLAPDKTQAEKQPDQAEAADEAEDEEEQEEDLFTSKKRTPQQKNQTNTVRSLDPSMKINLSEIACPHCHGVLPRDFGKLPMYRVVLLGASGCGKTTYMTSVAHLLTKGIGCPANLVRSARLSEESKRYFDYLITCQKEARIGATVRMGGWIEPTVFPIAMTVDTGVEKFILVMNDCPGEAVKDSQFITNYPALSDSDGVIFIIDPLSCFHARGNNDIKNVITSILNQEGIPVSEDAINSYHYAQESFQETIDSFLQLVTNDATKPARLRSLVMDLHKLDAIQPLLEEEGRPVTCISRPDRSDLSKQHSDGVNLSDLRRTSMQLSDVIIKSLQIGTYNEKLEELGRVFGKIYTLCTTTRNRNVAGQFVAPDTTSENNRGRAIADADLMGFRMLEPLLCVLAQLRLVAVKEGGDSQNEDELDTVEHRGFWSRLFRRNR